MGPTLGPLFFYTENLETLVLFYRDVLGLPVKTYEPGHSLWLAAEPLELVIHSPEPEWYPGPYEVGRDGVLLWMRTAETWPSLMKRIREAKVEVLAENEGSGPRDLLLIRDPDGRRIGIYRERLA